MEMEKNIKVNFIIIKNKGKEFIHLKMAVYLMVIIIKSI